MPYSILLNEVSQPRIKIVPIKDWPQGKIDPTEYDATTSTIHIKADYDYRKDPVGWYVHELEHHRLNTIGFKDDGKPYPTNNTERHTYMKQFKYLKTKGVTNWLPLMPHKKEHKKILDKYWQEA